VLGLLFYTDDGGSTFFRNVGWLLPDYTTLHPWWQCSSLQKSHEM
jgi:hypothetical protein